MQTGSPPAASVTKHKAPEGHDDSSGASVDEFLSDQEQDSALLQDLWEKLKFVALSSQPRLYTSSFCFKFSNLDTVGLGLRPSACLQMMDIMEADVLPCGV